MAATDPTHVTGVPGYTTPSGLALDAPGGYDMVKLTIPLNDMTTAKGAVDTSLNNILDSLGTIEKTLADLKLGWAGDTAAQAKELFDQWTACMTELVGTRSTDNPNGTDGVFQRLMTALASAVNNYDQAEDFVVTKLFGPLTAAITTPASGSSDPSAAIPKGDNVTDPKDSVVGETF